MSTQALGLSTDVDFDELNKYYSEYIEGIDFSGMNTDDNKVNNLLSNKKKDICQNCGNNQFVEDQSQGIVICINRSCGEVLRSIVDNNPEWKQFDDNDKAGARCTQAHNPLLPQSSLGTTISGFGRSRVKVLHTWAAMPYKERSLNNEFKKIHNVCQKYEILKCVEDDTKIMYKMANDCKHQSGKNKGKYIITRGVNRTSIIAGCLFFACLRKGVTRTSKEIGEMWGITEMEINRGCKNLLKLFKLREKESNSNKRMTMGSTKPEHFIKRYCNELRIKSQYIDSALKIAINVEKLNIASGHTPLSSAAASILLMAELHNLTYITKKKLALEFNISDTTIYNTFKELEIYKHILINDHTTDEIVKQTNSALAQQLVPPEVIERMKKFSIGRAGSHIVPSIQSTELEKNNSDASVSDSNSDYFNNGQYDTDNADNTDEDYFSESDILSNKIPTLLLEKHEKIDKLLKAKSTKDILEDVQTLRKSHNLIKEMTKDLGKYINHLNMFD